MIQLRKAQFLFDRQVVLARNVWDAASDPIEIGCIDESGGAILRCSRGVAQSVAVVSALSVMIPVEYFTVLSPAGVVIVPGKTVRGNADPRLGAKPRAILLHPYHWDDETTDDLLANLAPTTGSLAAGRDDFRYHTSRWSQGDGSAWERWAREVGSGTNSTGEPSYHLYLIPDEPIGLGTRRVGEFALAARRSIFVLRNGFAPLLGFTETDGQVDYVVDTR